MRKEGVTVKITAMPARHTHRPLSAFFPSVMGSLLEFRAPGEAPCRIYISGDTLLHGSMRHIPGDVDLAVLHLGDTHVAGLPVTMSAADGVELVRWLHPRKVVPVHYGDYPEMREGVEPFARAMEAAGLSSRLHILERGATLALHRSAAQTPVR
jgi:L-ascorbate metabolism protein UlaG (beta-lactamase superfamily)